MLKIEVELLGITRTVSKRFEEVLGVNNFHKVFKARQVKRATVVLTGLYCSSRNYRRLSSRAVHLIQTQELERLLKWQNSDSSRHRSSSGMSGAQEGKANPARIPGKSGHIFSKFWSPLSFLFLL
ncbi:unnamed protein product [Prunus armeniaca]